MKTSTKFLALFLALLMAMSIVLTACSKPADDTTKAPDNANTPEDTSTQVPEDTQIKSELPADLKFPGQSFRIFYRAGLADMNIVGNSETGDNIALAVYKRNQIVQEQLGVTFEYIPSISDAWKEVSAEIRTVVSSAEDSYDMVASSGNSLIQYYLGEYMRDVSDGKYFDWEKPWWYLDGIKELSLDGETYRYLIGDLILANFLNAGTIYVNKDLFAKTYGDYSVVPQLVLNGEWTHDKFYEYISGCYYDENGSTTVDEGDILGLIGPISMGTNYFHYSTDAESYSRDAEGKPTITVNNDRTLGVLDSLVRIYDLPNVVFDGPNDGTSFATGKSLFYIVNLSYLTGTTLRSSDVNYGILPVPKYDLSQENYRSFIHNSSSEVCVPKTVPDDRMDLISACMEALAYQGYITVIPELYDIALKQKYSTTPEDAMMIDIIHDTLTKNLLYEYSANIGRIGTMLQDILQNRAKGATADFASAYQTKITQAEQLLDAMYEANKNH